MTGYFDGLCVNCGERIDAERLSTGLVCRKCVSDWELIRLEEEYGRVDLGVIRDFLKDKGRLGEVERIWKVGREAEEFSMLFAKVVGRNPWPLQKTWAKRVADGESFVALAPTGIGKTTFGIAMSLFVEGKSYLILPTKLLTEMVWSKLEDAVKKTGKKKKILVMGRTSKAREELKSGDFDILVTTSMFLVKNINDIKEHDFSFIFVDDVDSFLKQARNVERVLSLMGLNEDDLKEAWEATLKVRGWGRWKRTGEKEDDSSEHTPREILASFKEKVKGVLVISSATAKAKTSQIVLFRQILGFDVNPYVAHLRNIDDILVEPKESIFSEGIKLVEKWGGWCFTFVNSEDGKESVAKFKDMLTRRKIKAITYEEFGEEERELFEKGDIKVVIGISSARNPLARGIDMPAVRYAIFLGIPRMVFPIREIGEDPPRLFNLLITLKDIFEERRRVLSYIETARKYIGLRAEDLSRYPPLQRKFQEIRDFIQEHLSNPDFLSKIKSSEDIPIRVEGNELKIVVADSAGYIQCSGRTSRLYPGGLSKGISFLIFDDEKAFFQLKKRFRFEMHDVEFKESVVDKAFKEVDRDRRRIKKALKGIPLEKKDVFGPKSILFIVESPNKARTIANLIGRPSRRRISEVDVWELSKGDANLMIVATYGHIFDLVKNEGHWGVLKLNGNFLPIYTTIKRCRKCGESFEEESECPKCGSKDYDDKIRIIQALRRVAFESDEVLIATDPDTEGEKIAWDVYLALKPINHNIKRVEYHEVTRKAILEAISSPRDIDLKLISAQVLRRIADRWVGFFLSKRLQATMDKVWLSAGRVQSPILGWLIRREQEMRKKVCFLRVKAGDIWHTFKVDDLKLAKEISKTNLRLEIELKEEYEELVNPPPPLETSEMLRLSHFSAARTMELAQRLFEAGFITYHRTDSIRVSNVGISLAKEYVLEKFGEDFSRPRAWGEGGAHECIRPTKAIEPDEIAISVRVGNISLPQDALKLYRLIFQTFIASQMKPVRVRKGKISIKISRESELVREDTDLVLEILDNGWNLINPIRLPRWIKELKDKIVLEVEEVERKIASPVVPYTQGILIDEMKRIGIGRPSTWAQIVKILLDRGYCIEKKNFLFPTKLGKDVYNYLAENYPKYCSEDFTRELEEKMTLVEKGEEEYSKVLKALYNITAS